jgi:hydroxymethylpyrimidine pyrophosphatase-like HAD family hydrolase
MKRLIVFDLDGTLAPSKQPLGPEVGDWLGKLLAVCRVAVISGGAWPQFQTQLIAHLPADAALDRLSLLPTSGTRFMKYDAGWQQLYAEDFSADEKARILRASNQTGTGAIRSRIVAARSPCPRLASRHRWTSRNIGTRILPSARRCAPN